MRNISLALIALFGLLALAAPAQAQVYSLDGQMVMAVPTSDTRVGIWPLYTTAPADSLVLKNSGGNVYGFQVNPGATAGMVLVFDAASKPSNGAVTPVKCYQVAANSTLTVSYSPIALGTTNGAVIVFSNGANCNTLVATNASMISGEAR